MGIHKLHSMILKPGAKSLKLNIISEAKGEDSLIGFLGETVVPTGDFKSTTHEGALSLMWKGGVLRVNHALLEDGECSRYDITWTSVKPSKLVDSFDLRNGHWYGGAELKKQAWPLEKAKVSAIIEFALYSPCIPEHREKTNKAFTFFFCIYMRVANFQNFLESL